MSDLSCALSVTIGAVGANGTCNCANALPPPIKAAMKTTARKTEMKVLDIKLLGEKIAIIRSPNPVTITACNAMFSHPENTFNL